MAEIIVQTAGREHLKASDRKAFLHDLTLLLTSVFISLIILCKRLHEIIRGDFTCHYIKILIPYPKNSGQ